MHQLVTKDVSEEGIERQQSELRRLQHNMRDRHQCFVELRILDILQHHPLRALFLYYSLVVRQVIGSGLDAAVSLTRCKHFIHYANRRRCTEFWIAVFRIDWKIVLKLLQMAAELSELGSFGHIAQGYIRFE